MKKMLAAVILVMVLLTGNLYADDGVKEEAQNILALSVGLIGADLSYERVFFSNFSVLGQISYTNWIIADSLSVDGKARWYPFNGAFFLDIGLGFSNGYNAAPVLVEFIGDILLGVITLGLWFTSDNFQQRWDEVEIERHNGFSIQPGFGWNIGKGKRSGILVPISMGLNIRLSNDTTILPYFKIGLGIAF
ncbi:MAG: hypothetical protein FWD13_10025 [Treponema sp.]|nr:hypothetical protein [Treponema sp.]